MAKSLQNSKKSDKKIGSLNGSAKAPGSNGARHKLNVPMKKSEMSKADKATLKAWEYTYKNRDRRVD